MKIKLIPKSQKYDESMCEITHFYHDYNDVLDFLMLVDNAETLTELVDRAKSVAYPYMSFDKKIIISRDEALDLLGLDKDKYIIL